MTRLPAATSFATVFASAARVVASDTRSTGSPLPIVATGIGVPSPRTSVAQSTPFSKDELQTLKSASPIRATSRTVSTDSFGRAFFALSASSFIKSYTVRDPGRSSVLPVGVTVAAHPFVRIWSRFFGSYPRPTSTFA